VGVLLLASIPSRGVAILALVLFAACTAVSMALLSTGLGTALATRTATQVRRGALVALAAPSLVFGVYYAADALGGLPPSL
jgi:hypothetical protein